MLNSWAPKLFLVVRHARTIIFYRCAHHFAHASKTANHSARKKAITLVKYFLNDDSGLPPIINYFNFLNINLRKKRNFFCSFLSKNPIPNRTISNLTAIQSANKQAIIIKFQFDHVI